MVNNNLPAIMPVAGAVKAYLDRNPDISDRLGAGIQPSFAVLSIKGKEWSIKHRGEIHPLYRDGSREPLQTIEVVIIDAAPHLSRTYYEDSNKYVDGSAERPDCSSINNIVPDAGVPKKQSDTCAMCPKSFWGSRITPQGKKAKACQENKRLAVTSPSNIDNEEFGGPMLLRVPVMSHGDLQAYGQRLKAAGVPAFAVITRIGFLAGVAHPQLVFSYGGTLSEEDALQAIRLIDDPRTQRILNEAAEHQNGEAPPPAQETPSATSLSQKAINAAIDRSRGFKAPEPAPKEEPEEEPAPAKTDFVKEAKELAAKALAAAGTAPAEPAAAPAETAPKPKKTGFGGSVGASAPAPAKATQKPATPAAPASFDKLMDGLLETQR